MSEDVKDKDKNKPVTADVKDDDKKSLASVPYERFKEVNEKKKTLETELEEFRIEKAKREEADLSAKELLIKKEEEIKNLKATHKQTELKSSATEKLLEEGFPRKWIPKLLSDVELTEDNIDKKVKEIVKEFGDIKSSKKPIDLLRPDSTKQETEQSYKEVLGDASKEFYGEK